MSDAGDVVDVIERFFRVGVTKDLSALKEIQVEGAEFSSFSDVPPHDLKDYPTTLALEELRFVSISDYEYAIKNPKIELFGDAAVAAFELTQRGMLVDNKTFTGKSISISGRATFVLIKRGTWKIVHFHLSQA